MREFLRSMNLWIFAWLVILPLTVFAQVLTPTDDFNVLISSVLSYVKIFGGLPWVLKIAAIFAVLISFTKVSFLREMTWDKIPQKLRLWLGPLLGLIYGLFAQNVDITLAGTLAYMLAGAGAPYVHEMLDGIKQIPGIGKFWIQLIDFIKGRLGAPATAYAKKIGQ